MRPGKATREAYGEALAELGHGDPRIIALDADLAKSTMSAKFGDVFPDRFFNVGIAEANMAGMAAGLALSGMVPFISSFACFLMCKGFDQLRMGAAYPQANVKVVGSHSGIMTGEDGVSQQSVEDVALAMALPGFIVLVPADEVETREVVKAAAAHVGPVYIRTSRPKTPVIYEHGCDFRIGRANQLRDGSDLTLIANGTLVAPCLEAAEQLAAGHGIQSRVLDMATVRPLDDAAVEAAARDTGAILVAEEHLMHGGLCSAVAQSAARSYPVPMSFVALDNTYAESGQPEELMRKYGLCTENIVAKAVALVERVGVRAVR